MGAGIQAKIHEIVGKRKVEFFLGLRERPRIGCRRPGADLFGDPQEFRELVDLGLVEVRDRLEVRRAVTVLHEKSLVVFQPVRRSGHRVVQPVGVIVLDLFARALLHVGGGNDTEIDVERQPQLLQPLVGRLHHQRSNAVSLVAEDVRDRDLAAPAGAKIGNQFADEFIAPRVATGRRE